MPGKGESKYRIIFISIIFLLLAPALLVNLGLIPLSADEATRATVALEMEYSGNLVTPTINGVYYFNKPPAYNWLLLSLFRLTGSHSEFIIRIPTVVSLLIFGFLIFFFVSKHTDRRVGLISALAFITSGRILFYDSMLGLIDTTFSMLIFLNFMLIYELLKKEKYGLLFFLSWLITAVTFLMKGLPALVFEGLTLAAALIYFRRFRKLFSRSQILSFLMFVFITGGYYYLLWRDNPDTRYFSTLVSESAKRTFVEYGWWKTFLHLFTFPAEQLYHLAPWSLLLLLLFRKKSWKMIREHHFIRYLGLIFIVNIPVYWISYETYPRYLFMLYPLLLSTLVFLYFRTLPQESALRRIIDPVYAMILVIMIPAGLFALFLYPFHDLKRVAEVYSLVVLPLMVIIVLFLQHERFRLHLLVIVLLLMRLGFDLAVLPERYLDAPRVKQKKQAIHAAELSKDHELRLTWFAPCSHETTFYIERTRGSIMERYRGPFTPGSFYIIDDRDKLHENELVLYRFETRWKNSPLRLSEIKDPGIP